ncbi:MAG: hypothetical protein AVDCRST_MAG52-426, partial [uncultured Blastococcus sp.]
VADPQPGERRATALRVVPPRPALPGLGRPAPPVLRAGLPTARLRAALGHREGRPPGRRRPGVAQRAGRAAGPPVPAALRARGRADPADREADQGRTGTPAGRARALHRAAGPAVGQRARRL